MKPRTILIAAAVVVALAGGGVLAAPMVAQHVAEKEVDKALKRIRKQSTSVADRGPVTVDLGTRTVTVKDVSIEAPGGASAVTISALSIVNPVKHDEQLTADGVLFENVKIAGGGETVLLPRIEIKEYSGPARGLVTTPGVGRMARSQADVIAQVSAAGVSIPSFSSVNDATGIRRTARDVAVGRIVAGVVERATVESVELVAPELSDGDRTTGGGVDLTTGQVVYDRLNLPTLWRFYAGDGTGDREPLVSNVSAAKVSARFAVGGAGRMRIALDEISVGGVKTRPFNYPVTELDEIARQIRRKEPLTPAEIRRQLLLLADTVRAVSFDRIAATGVEAETYLPDRPKASARMASWEIGPYADGRVERLRADGLDYARDDGDEVAFGHVEASSFDASRLIGYVEKIGRDEALLTFEPPAREFVRIAPRLSNVDAAKAVLSFGGATARFDKARFDLDAPLEAAPQRVAARVEGLDATPPPESWFGRALDVVAIKTLKGSAEFGLTLDPTTETLSLDAFDYDFEGLGHVAAKGKLADVDPAIVVSAGATFIDKLSAVTMQPFTLTAKNDGAVETLLRRAAEKAGAPAEEYRETAAREARDLIGGLFGPSAAESAKALAEFIRDPRTLDVTIGPKTPDTKLIEFLQSLSLGPAGIAQTIDVTILYKR